MKKSSLIMLLLIPLLVGCNGKSKRKSGGGGGRVFEVPVVDLANLHINLPEMPTLDKTSPVKRDGSNDIIDIYEVSDMHAMIDFNIEKGYWGFSGLANFFNEKRSDNPGTIVVSSGDMWQGGAESNLTRGKVVAEAMRYVGFESMALGNHEFDWGEDVMKQNAERFTQDMPILCGNLVDTRTSARPTYIQPSTVIERGGYKVGVIGTIGAIETSIAKTMFANFRLTSSTEFAKEEAKRLKESEHCDVVVWCSHENAIQMTPPENVDVVFGGHEHNDINQTAEGASVGHEVPKLATKNYGESIAHATLEIDPSTKAVVSATGELLKTTENTELRKYLVDEAKVKNLLDQYKDATSEVKKYELNKVSGTFRKDFELANLSCKAMYEMFKLDNCVCALQNGTGGVRIDIEPGMVTYGDVYTAFPFDNEIAYFTVKGSNIGTFFDRGSVKNVEKYVSKTKLSEYDSNTDYTFITTDYVCTNILKMTENQFTKIAGSVIRDVVAEYIFKHSGLKASAFSSDLPNFQAPSR